MRKWTKVAAVVLVTAAGGAAAAPLVTGNMAEQRMQAFAENPVLLQSPNVEWAVTSYESSYLGATATSELTLRDPERGESVTVVLDHDIKHALAAGDALLRIRTTPRIPEGRPQEVARELFGERAPLTVDYRLRMDGVSVARVQSPSTDGTRELDYGAVDWKGLDGEVTANAAGDGDYRLEAPGLRFEPASGQVESASMGALDMQGTFESTDLEDIWVGAGTAKLAFMRVEGGADGDMALNGLELSEDVSLRQGRVEIRLDGRIAQIVVPEREVNDVRMSLDAKRLAPELLQALQTISRETAMAESQAQQQRVTRQILGRVPWGEVARAEPEVALQLEGEAGRGPVSATARVGVSAPSQEQAAQLRMVDLSRRGNAEIRLRAPEPVVVDLFAQRAQMGDGERSDAAARSAARQQVQALQAQGWIQAEGDTLSASASYDRGQIRVNGRGLFGMAMGN